MSEQNDKIGGGWDKVSDTLSKASDTIGAGAKKAAEAAAVGAQKAKEAASVGAEKARQAMDDVEKRAEERKAAGVSSGGWDSAVEFQQQTSGNGAGSRGVGSILVDQSEGIVSTIGSNYLQNFLSGGAVEKGIGVLTQKRFYFKGKNFGGTGKEIKSATQEGVVSIEDITYTMFTHTRHIGYLVFAIILTLASIPFFSSGWLSAYGLIPLAAAISFYILYFVKRQTAFLVSFPGGGFAFDIRYYPIADIRDFQRQLHLLKDHAREAKA